MEVKIGDLVFVELMSCTLQEPNIQSGKAVVMPCNAQPHKFDEFFTDGRALSSGAIKGEVGVEEVLAVSEAAQGGGISTVGLKCFNSSEC